MIKVAVLGAGLAGLAAALRLQQRFEARVFEKSGAVGGRVATYCEGSLEFDHGAQYFTVRDAGFGRWIAELAEQGAVSRWAPRLAHFVNDRLTNIGRFPEDQPAYVGVPRMDVLGKVLAQGLDVRLNSAVVAMRREGRGWRLTQEGGTDLGVFDWIVSAVPGPIIVNLLPHDHVLRDQVSLRPMQGCYALMVALGHPIAIEWDAARLTGPILKWMCVNSSKPGRGAAPTLVAHSSSQWAEAHMESDEEWVRAELLAATERVLGQKLIPARIGFYRWRYAQCASPAADGAEARALMDDAARLVLCGDWTMGSRIESAYLSGISAADQLMDRLP